MLITIETCMKQLAEGVPSGRGKLRGDRLVPNGGWSFHIMFNQTNLDRGINNIREEILLTEGMPTFWVSPIERWKRQFRKSASELIGASGLGVGRVNGWYRRGMVEMEGFVMKIGMGRRRGGETDVQEDGARDPVADAEE